MAKNFVFEILDPLQAPILTHSAAWKDCIPERLLKLVTLERLKYVLLKREYATDVEVVIFIMTRTFEAPMSSEWTDIYTIMACRVLQENFGEDHWNKGIARDKELTEYEEKHLLMPLRRHIYEKRRKLLKLNLKDLTPTKTVKPKIVQTQLQIF